MRLALKQQGIPLWLNSPMTELITDVDGTVTGAVVEQNGRQLRIHARRGVILASGGFDHDTAWRRQHLSVLDKDCSFGNPAAMGDGIRAGEKVGGSTDLLDEAWWFPAICWPDGRLQFMLNERMMPSQFVVNGEGNRFINEAAPYMDFAHAMIDGQRSGVTHIPCWLITDIRSFHRYVVGGHLPIPKVPFAPVPTGWRVPKAWLDSGVVKEGNSFEELAAKIEVPAANLRATAERFNELARKGHDDDFNRGDSAYDNYYGDPTLPNPNLYPLSKPPYYAFQIILGDLGTSGGSAHRRIRPRAPRRRQRRERPLRRGQRVRCRNGTKLRGRGRHHRPGHDVRLRRRQTHRKHIRDQPARRFDLPRRKQVKISLFYEFPLPRPWTPDDEHKLFQDGLDEVEAADKAGFSTVWLTEHHFLEEYCHSTAPEIFLAAASQRTKNIRLGFGIMHLPPAVNHPARVAERVSTLDLLSNGRVEFGTGESSSVGELGGFGIDPADKRKMWEEALEVSIRCMLEEPFTGFKGEHVEMPPRNVVPKPLQKPHPPVWVACTRPASVSMAAQKGLGALSFAYTGPGPLTERVNRYYKEFEESAVPVTPQMNPNILAIGGDLSMMVAPTDEQAVERIGNGGGFFAFGIMHYYMSGMHTPGRTGVWKRYLDEIANDPTIAYGPGRGPIGSPATVREFLRGYEESGVDELILLLTPRTHEATMESIELMGKEVLPEFIERDEKAVAEKVKRLEPIIEKAEARREPSKTPAFDETYAFGGLPTGRENYTANEVSLAMEEMNAGIEQAAAQLRTGEGWTSRNLDADKK